MADQPVPTPAAPPPPVVDWKQLVTMLWSIMPTGIMKTALGVLLGIMAGTHYAASVVESKINAAPKGIIDKIIPPKFRASEAIGKIQFGNAGCTATIIGPINDGDSVIDVLTAAHCVNVGATGKMTLKDGRVLTVKCVTRNAKADVAWLQAERPGGFVPALLLCEVPPPPGSPVWHEGYGIDKPGNHEVGTVTGMTSDHTKVRFQLSVSSGDSGGGIICTADDRVISPVCCTSCLGCVGDVLGGAPAAAAAIRPRRQAATEEPPMARPMLYLPGENWPYAEG